MNKLNGKLAAIALLAILLTSSAVAMLPNVINTSADFAYPPGTWRIKLQDLGNKTVPAGLVTVYLWNLTKNDLHAEWPAAGPIPPLPESEGYILSYATVGAGGIVTFPGLPGDTWDVGVTDDLTYAISANYTINGDVTEILVLPLLKIFDQGGPSQTMISLAALLNDTTEVINHHFTWEDLDASEADQTRPGYIVFLAPVAFRLIDEAGFPLVGAGVEVWAGVYIYLGLSDMAFYRIATATANGTFGSEFIGNMPYAVPLGYPDKLWDPEDWTGPHNVGWVNLLLPALLYDEDVIAHGFVWNAFSTWTGLQNITLLVRYKTNDPTKGPIVGRFTIDDFDYEENVDWTPVSGDDKDPPYDEFESWLTIRAYRGDWIMWTELDSGAAYPYVWCNVRWKYEVLLDVDEAFWFTKEAEVFLKWEQGPAGAYQYVGTNVAPGMVLIRYPANLENDVTDELGGDTGYDFTLTLGVEWRFSIIAFTRGIDPIQLMRSWPGRIDTTYRYGLWPGTNKEDSDFGTLTVGEVAGIAWNFLMCNMSYVKGIKLDSSAEVPQALRNEIAVKIILPAGLAHTVNVSFVWVTNNTGFVTLPDTTALRANSDIYDLWSQPLLWGGNPYLPGLNALNFSGWLPIVYHGQTNFLAWFKGVKVLDTTVPGGYPAWEGTYLLPGNLPLPLGSRDPPGATFNYGIQWNYTLAIYELGFVLEFTPGPKDEVRPVPYYVPFFFRYPNGELIGPTITVPIYIEGEEQDYGIYDLVKAAPGGTYSDFMIVWKASVIRAVNATTGDPIESITLDGNMHNLLLQFPVYDLNVTGWTQDPDVLVNIKVNLYSTTDFAEFGLPYYIVRMLVDPEAAWYPAVLPPGWVIYPSTGAGGFPFWFYKTNDEWVDGHNTEDPHSAHFIKLPEKLYDIRISTPDDEGTWGTEDKTALGAGFRSVDTNVTLYWTQDPWIGAPYEHTSHNWLNIDTYVYDPNVAIKDAGGNALPLLPDTHSAVFLVEPWYDSAPDFYDMFVDPTTYPFNPYFIRANSTDANGKVKFKSINASEVEPLDDMFDPARVADDYPEESRYLIGESTLESADPYRFMVYYKGVLVFNESIPLENPYVSKDHTIITSVYPYVFRVTNWPLPDEDPRFGIEKLDVDVFWAGLNLTWWPSFSLVTETAVIEFSLLNASKLEKGFNMSVLERLWGPPPVNPVTLIEIPYTPVPPYFSANLFVESGITDQDGRFRVLVPVWNYSYSANFYTYLEIDDVLDAWGEEFVGGPSCPWYWPAGPLGINLPTWGDRDEREASGFFGTPVYANWTTKPGVTNNIPADDDPRLAATLQIAWDLIDQDVNWLWVFSVNATGLVNTDSYYDEVAPNLILGKSLTTVPDARPAPLDGIGVLSGGLFQGRQAIGIFEDEVVGPPQPYSNFYAKLQVWAPVNDIGVTVWDAFWYQLPNQYVEVWDDSDDDHVFDRMLWSGYTPIDDEDALLVVRSTPTNMLWGFYDFAVATTNMTQVPAHDLEADWQLDPQWLVALLPGGDVDWVSWYVDLRWPTKLQLTIYAGDGARYLDNAWVFIVDGVNNENVTAALTDDAGYPGSIDITDPTLITEWAADGLATGDPEGSRLNLGFNLGMYGYVYWVDMDGTWWDAAGKWYTEGTPCPLETAYKVYCTSGSGKWIVKVFFKAPDAGAVKTFGRVEGVSVWDTFRDQPQHRYIYLGINLPPSATGEDNDTAQVRTFNTKVYDLRIRVVDQSPSARPIVSAPITITAPDPHPDWVISKTTSPAGEVSLALVPAGKYLIAAASPVSLYGKPAAQIAANVEARVIDAPAFALVPLPIFDATIKLVTPSGKPIVGAGITVAGVALGVTDAEGSVLATSIPSGSFTVAASWFGQDISPTTPLTVTLSRTYVLTASKVALVQIQVVGAQNQGLAGAHVSIKIGTTTVFSGIANTDGVVAIELPYGTYDVKASHKGVEASKTISVTGDTVEKLTTGVFIELFGQGLTFAGFALWVVAILVVILILVIAAQEYNIYRRKRLPQLFGAGPSR